MLTRIARFLADHLCLLVALLIPLLILLLAAAFSSPARAEGVWLTTGFFSKHLTHDSDYFRREGRYREANVGAGLEYRSFALGVFKNSIDQTSRYAFYRWMPLRHEQWSAGLAAGVIDGYAVRSGGFFPALVPTASWEGKTFGVNAIFLPKLGHDVDATLAVQFKVKLDF